MSSQNVLIVEDDIWLAEHHARVISKAGYTPIVTHHAVAAIAAVDVAVPAAIILDVLLTGSTAYALLNELQSYVDTSAIPVILCTNLAEDITLKEVAPYGVKKVLNKMSMEPEDLVVSLRSVLA